MGFTEEYSKVQPERVCGDHNVRYRGVCPVCVDRLDPNAPWMPGTLYAQKTPSGDVRLFTRTGEIKITAWSPYKSGCPKRNSKSVVVNGVKWRLVWLPGVAVADQYSESEDSKIIRQYGIGAAGKKAGRRPRLTR